MAAMMDRQGGKTKVTDMFATDILISRAIFFLK
jgi:hypothetical protein